jgi:hypothetical protein
MKYNTITPLLNNSYFPFLRLGKGGDEQLQVQNKRPLDKPTPVQQGKANTSPATPAQKAWRESQTRSRNATVRPIPQDPATVEDPTERRIEYLRRKTDRTLDEGLELEELELGVEKSKEINAGWTSDQVRAENARLRAEEKKEREYRQQFA